VKQLTLAIANFESGRKVLPLASTAYLLSPNKSYGRFESAVQTPLAPIPLNDLSQIGDGYSWIVQIMNNIELGPMYDALVRSSANRKGNLRDGAFDTAPGTPQVTLPNGNSVYVWATPQDAFRCPSHSGPNVVDASEFYDSATAGQVGVGTYVALAGSAYVNPPSATAGLQSGTAASPAGCTPGAMYCGDGALPFPGATGTTPNFLVTKRGLKVQQISDGMAHTILMGESREERYASWYSGRAAYAVGHLPNTGITGAQMNPISFVPAAPASQIAVWQSDYPSLNKGDVSDETRFYFPGQGPHPGTTAHPLHWGPSSRHDRVIVHGFADSHADALRDDMDGSTYLQLITRAGREITSE
jgi:hypothetical protein